MSENQSKNAWDEQEIPNAEKTSDIWKDFSEKSTLHGLKNAVLNRSVYLRAAWSLVVLTAFSYLLYSTIQSCSRYFDHGTTFRVNQKINDSLIFPAVTICSKSIADKKKLFALDTDQDFKDYGLNISACAATAKVRAGAPCGHALLCACVSLTLTTKPPVTGCNKSLQGEIIHALKSHHVDFSFEEFFLTFSQKWNEMIHWCSYGLLAYDCSAYFKPLINHDGLCYTFNSNKTNAMKSEYAGAPGGLRIVLKTQLDRVYFPKYFEGFSVLVNDQSEFINHIGINAGLGFFTSISLELRKSIFQQYPYGAKCDERPLKGAPQYSETACYAQCWSDYFYKNCACRPAGYNALNDAISCYSIHTTCTEAAMGFFLLSSCDCPTGCEVTSYNTEVSYGPLPHKTTAGVSEIFLAPNYSRENFAVIEIGFKDLTYTQREEKFVFEKTSLLGEVGGNMGLLLGCSLLTLVEFIELLFSFLMLRLKRNNVSVH